MHGKDLSGASVSCMAKLSGRQPVCESLHVFCWTSRSACASESDSLANETPMKSVKSVSHLSCFQTEQWMLRRSLSCSSGPDRCYSFMCTACQALHCEAHMLSKHWQCNKPT